MAQTSLSVRGVETFTSVVELLDVRCQEQDRQLYTFLADGEKEDDRFDRGTLRRRALDIAAALKVRPGERALLLYPPGLEFIAAFFGCLVAGVVAVPAFPPTSRRALPRLTAIARDASPQLVLTTSATVERYRAITSSAPELSELRWQTTDDLDFGGAPHTRPMVEREDLAFLQYTSGSTALPKGVQVSHGNLLANEAMIRRAFNQSSESVVVGWLPLYHDMGLIGNVLQPLFCGGSCVLMSPVSFLQKPRRWLAAISRYRATTSGGPNFAYDLCLRRIPEAERAGLDLSSWRLAYNGSEPVRAETLERFTTAFTPYGFNRRAFFPCYGLAEATLYVSGGSPLEEPRQTQVSAAALAQNRVESPVNPADARALAGSGRPDEDMHLLIVDSESRRRLPEGRVGEIWLAGENVAGGYWNNPKATRRDFEARLADGEEAATSFLRTGDLGFLRRGELYLTGRLKDLIIVRGRNHYPQDLELTAESSHPVLLPGACAAFTVAADDRLVLVLEVERRAVRSLGQAEAEEVAEAVRRAVAEVHEIVVHEVVLLKTGTLPKTSSGKIMRHACRRGHLEGTLKSLAHHALTVATDPMEEVHHWRREDLLAIPQEERGAMLEAALGKRLAALLHLPVEDLEPQRPLTALGLDSLRAMELLGQLEEDLGVAFDLSTLLGGASLEALCTNLLAQLEAAPVNTSGGPEIHEAPTEGNHPLSPGQQALWFLERLAPENAAYNLGVPLRLSGDLDYAALERALNHLLLRHGALRTQFPAPEGEPGQQILAADGVNLALRQEDAVDWPAARLRERLAELASKPFDLTQAPLVRVHLLYHGEQRHTLLLVAHHVVVDFQSLVVLLEDLGTLYSEESEKARGADRLTSHLSDESNSRTLRFVDHVRWQARRLAGPRGHELATFWEGALADSPPGLELPTDRPRPPLQTFVGGAVEHTLGREDRGIPEGFAARQGVTFFTLLAAVFHTFLHRLSGAPRVLLGTPHTGRDFHSLERVVGFFVNPIVLDATFRGAPSFHQVLAQEQSTVLAALAHRDQPFEKLVERLQPERDVSRSPLFQVMLSWQSLRHRERETLGAFALGQAGGSLHFGGLEAESEALPHHTATFDLELVVAPVPDGLGFRLLYNRDLFDHTTAARLLGHCTTLLASATAHPRESIYHLSWMTPAARHQALVAGNGSARPIPPWDLFQLVRDSAARRPEAVAVTGFKAASNQLTYGELIHRAQRLATRLAELGAGSETPVAVCLEREPEMLVALLGTLASGAFYIPLDPTYPKARLESMLRDAFASPARSLFLSQRAVVAQLGDLPTLAERVLCVDDGSWNASESRRRALPERAGEQLAYVIYTSGSTGRPKGVQVTHRGVVNFLRAVEGRLGLTGDDRLLAVTTLAFDIAVLELFLPLLVGGRTVLADRNTAASGTALGKALDRMGATVMQATPASWRLLLESGWRGRPAFVAASGGEALPPELARRLVQISTRVWNLYGPTETTIWSAAAEVSEDTVRVGLERGDAAMGLGEPLDNNRLYLLDQHLHPVPLGVSGEVYIAGDGLARSYLGRPALTAERFLPDACTPPVRGGRLYRVGDLARRLGDGSLHFLGRVDHQVKVRGYRIELGEIEAVLESLPGVARAAVVVREEQMGDPRLVAYVVAAEDRGSTAESWRRELQEALRSHLPEYMVPSLYLPLEALPLTANGKVDRRRLPEPPRQSSPSSTGSAPLQGFEPALAELWCEVLGVDEVGRHDNFFDLGGHSLLVARLEHRICRRFERDDITVVDLFRHPSIAAQARLLAKDTDFTDTVQATVSIPPGDAVVDTDIAVVGLALRLPGADTPGEFWNNLRDGVESITFFSREDLQGNVESSLLDDPAYVPARGVMSHATDFDAAFFGFPPREAEIMDPQHRVFLEGAWQALEDAGYPPGTGARVGVFAGVGLNTYLLHLGEALLSQAAGDYQAFVSNDKDFLPTRVSYKLDLKGPSVNVQTACSSSLVAVHLACQSLLRGESDMALAGGITVRSPQEVGYRHQPGGILSDDGHCRAFDARGGGTVLGNGMGIVVLKPLSRALADGDRVRAVIKGSAINNDGGHKVGYTAPGLEGQVEVLRQALQAAQVEPETLTLIEAHGTGTPLGDPIEAAALAEVFQERPDDLALHVGSVKTNIGHLDTAAGIAGLIKAVLALEHRQIPPSLHFDTLNPKIEWSRSPLQVAQRLHPWQVPVDLPRRAGVSSFGIGGTNAHVILEEAPQPEDNTVDPVEESSPPIPQLLVLSARSDAALDAATERLGEELRHNENFDLGDVAFTLQQGRKVLDHRRFLLSEDRLEAAELLSDASAWRTVRQGASDRPVVFLFPGQGSQYAGMARELYEQFATFREEVDRCTAHLEPILGLDLRTLLWPAEGDREALRMAGEQLRQTRFTQPALFVVEYALARLFTSWGVRPKAMIGHSLGEYVAACLAGVFRLEDALGLIAERGRLLQALPAGDMLAVQLSRQEIEAMDTEHLSLAAVNGPRDSVVSGSREAIAAFEKRLRAHGVQCRPLHTSHAFHSTMVRPAVAPWVAAVSAVELRPPSIPFLSNVTGTWIEPQEATDPVYWGRHLAGTTDFAAGVETLLQDPEALLLEIGPGRSLGTLVRQQGRERMILPSLRHPRDPDRDTPFLLTTLGRLWLFGVEIDWPALHHPWKRRRVPLPTYPFERQRYWLDGQRQGPATDPLTPKANLGHWFYTPVWSQLPFPPVPPPTAPAEASTWILCPSKDASWVEGLGGDRRITVVPGNGFERLGPCEFAVNPTSEDDFTALFEAVGEAPLEILHGWLLDDGREGGGELATQVDAARRLGLLALVALAKSLGRRDGATVRLTLLSDRHYSVYGGEQLRPAAALAAGLLPTLAQEHRGVEVRQVDLDLALDSRAAGLSAVLQHPTPETTLALRFGRPWRLTHEPLEIPPPPPFAFEDSESVLITGGLGGVGLALAAGLVEQGCRRLALLGRRPLPPRAEWDDPTLDLADAQRIAAVRGLEERGARVLTVTADVTDRTAMIQVLKQVRDTLGVLRGVIHAAGLPGGGLLATRRREEMEQVLAPKVTGALVLLDLLTDPAPEFLVFCASINGVVGGYGQGDYCAANSFLDALAHARDHTAGPKRILSLDWDRFQGIGMAAQEIAAAPLTHSEKASVVSGHPLLGQRIESGSEKVVYRAVLRAQEQWVLHEHVVADRPTVPGATYLEMARAALAEEGAGQGLEISSVLFLRPLAMAEDEGREVLTVLEPISEDGGEETSEKVSGSDESSVGSFAQTPQRRLRVLSRDLQNPGPWEEHMQARVRRGTSTAPEPVDLPRLRERLHRPVESAREVAAGDTFLRTGSRWQSLRQLHQAEGELLAELELPAAVLADVETFALHPALLDIATGCVRLTRRESYLPLTYDALFLYDSLPSRLWSWVRERSGAGAEDGVLRCDVTLFDDTGRVRARVEGFAMRQIHDSALAALRSGASQAGITASTEANTNPTARELLRGVINSAAAREVLSRTLGAHTPPQLVVSPRDLGALAALYDEFDPGQEPESPQGPNSVHQRPRLDSVYVAPSEGLEGQLAAIWQRFLGIEKVGIHDNFFELGGTSLLAVQVVAEISKALGREVPTVSLFEAPTIEALAKLLVPKTDEPPAFAQTKSRIHKKKTALAHRRRRRAKVTPPIE